MISIEKDKTYRAVRARSGTGEKGDWALVAIADEKNEKRTATIFLDNPDTDIHEGQTFKIKEISRVKIGWKRDNNGEWKPDTTVSASIEPIEMEFGSVPDGPSPWDSEDWGQLPL